MLEQYKKYKIHSLDTRAYWTQQKKRSLNWKNNRNKTETQRETYLN